TLQIHRRRIHKRQRHPPYPPRGADRGFTPFSTFSFPTRTKRVRRLHERLPQAARKTKGSDGLSQARPQRRLTSPNAGGPGEAEALRTVAERGRAFRPSARQVAHRTPLGGQNP